MGFGQSAEGNAEQIRRKGGDGNMNSVVHHKAVVDFIGKDNELMLPCNFNNLLKNLPGIDRTCGIVGVDDNDCLCPVRYFFPDIVHVRIPFGLLVAEVMNGFSAGKGDAGSP